MEDATEYLKKSIHALLLRKPNTPFIQHAQRWKKIAKDAHTLVQKRNPDVRKLEDAYSSLLPFYN